MRRLGLDGNTMRRTQQKPSKIDNLTSLRFFAAFCIFLHHLSLLGFNVPKALGNVPLAAGVSFFYVLSGFVLSYAYAGKVCSFDQSTRFLAIRFFRLWPLHIVCAIFAIALYGIPNDLLRLYLYLTMQHSWIPTFRSAFFLNSVSWSISVEFFFYIIFSILLTMGTSRRALLIVIWLGAFLTFMAAASVGVIRLPPQGSDFMTGHVTDWSFFQLFPPVRIVEFFAGIASYKLYERFRIPNQMVLPMQSISVVLVIVAALTERWVRHQLWQYVPAPPMLYLGLADMFPFFAIFVYVFAHQDGYISKVLSNRILVGLGKISFAFYMSHRLILQSMVRNHIFEGHAYVAAFAAFALAVAVSMLLYKTIEMPALSWAKRTFASKSVRSGPFSSERLEETTVSVSP